MTTPTSPADSRLALWLGTWSRPSDRPAQVALALAIGLLVLAFVPHGLGWLASMVDLAHAEDRGRRRRFLTIASFFAAFLSLGYIAFYLRGGPRAPEAAAYWIQGRALSHGALSWTVPEPSASFRARNVLFVSPDRLAGIFAPGYPLLLAVGFLVGAPMLVGPLVAAALVVATWLVAHELAHDSPQAEAIARLAAGFSVVSAALRYHTADALPYGAAGVGIAAVIACALRAHRTGDWVLFGGAGFGVGALIALAPASALAVGVAAAALALSTPPKAGLRRTLIAVGTGALPGVLFLLVANRAATGHVFVSGASAYATVARDSGSTAAPLLRSLLVGLRLHCLDAANIEPLALLALVPLARSDWSGREGRYAALAGLVIAGQALVQWFVGAEASGGRGPGGGSLLVAVVPLEHALMAVGVARLAPRSFSATAVGLLAVSLAGFAIHASHVHEALAASDLGRPRFEPDVLREANVTHGLLFFDDDRGYELASEPGVPASQGVQAARLRGDDHDRLLYDALGHPQVRRYVASAASATVVFWTPPGAGSDTWRFEAESDWPPVAVLNGSLEPVDGANANGCASDGRALRLAPAGRPEATATLALPIPAAGGERRSVTVTPRVVQHGDGGEGAIDVAAQPGGPPLATWTWSDSAKPPTCRDLPPRNLELPPQTKRAWLIIHARGGPVTFDRTLLR